MKHILTSLWMLTLLTVVSSTASIVTINNFPDGYYFFDPSTDSRLADGSLVLVGAFDKADNIQNLPVHELQTLAEWTQFGSTETISFVGESGKLGDDVVNDGNSADTFFSGKVIFLWVFDGPTIYESKYYGIFTASSNSIPWIFPSGVAGSQTTINLDDDGGLIALVGSVDGNRLSLTGIVPEPATYAALLGVAVLCVAVVRRQRRMR